MTLGRADHNNYDIFVDLSHHIYELVNFGHFGYFLGGRRAKTHKKSENGPYWVIYHFIKVN